MENPLPEPRFQLGKLVATPAVLQSIEDSGQEVSEFANRHLQGDWGPLSEIDRVNNEEAIVNGDRIFSVHRTSNGTKIWVITEPVNEAGERYMTTVVLRSEH